ncbi:hypothetical protein ACLB2K_063293 [Fragaria x ananassa]
MSPPNLRPQRIPKRKMTRKTRILSDEDLYVERVQDSDPGLQKVALQGMSYCGAQIFEIYGLGKGVVDLAFCGSISSIGGLTFDELARDTLSFWVKAFSEDTAKRLENFGFIQFRPGGEYHGNNPEMSKLLHKAVRQKNESAFSVYQQHLANRPVNVLRDLIEFKSNRAPIPVGKVEPAVSIVQRFCTGGMSLGAISRETHEAIAIAMNRIGGKSNSGEGGEDPIRWKPLADVVDGYSPTLPHLKGLQNGDTATSAIKQVASGRFGVTPTFLVNADQLEIKIAQGAKPGEGGQLPGKKVSAYIARLRNSKPGVPLISPPPHHDIYSIEDLAQLIYDLHQVNPKAKVSVKLVAEAGIGTVASGVAKGNADVIQISGHDGGTGASPISSIKHAGGPWELGLTETHQTLIENGLRERVILRVDGGFKSGVDVLMAATMGADEYGFGSVAMIATGCVMARICHTNNCPVGVASQREELRARFPGVPGDLVNFFLYVAEEVRGMLAQLGYEKLDDIIGRTDLFRPRDISLVKTQHLDLGYILSNVGLPKWTSTMIRNQDVHTNGPVLDDILLADPEISEAIGNEKMVHKTIKIYNVDRAVCGRIAGVVAKKYGDTGFAGQLNITFTGSAGQSFGCFLTPGMNIRLVGEANDYVGKSISGGELVVTPAENTGFCPEDATIVGNTCLYGATGGQIFVRGKAGERFAVRNSLAQAVVEGTGDHCCEYMTGGCVVVLGKVGRNVAAGMTGGIICKMKVECPVDSVNREIVKIQRVNAPVGLPSLWSIKEALDDFNSGKDSGRHQIPQDLMGFIEDYETVFLEMLDRKICIGQSLLYVWYASFLESKGKLYDAQMVYHIGISSNAKPAEWVTKAHAFFLERMSELVSSTHEVDNGQCIQFESHINPWSNSTMKALLKKITPRLVKFDGYHATNKAYSGKVALSSLKKSSRNKTIEIGRTKYQITGCAGQGAFAEVYKAYVNCNPDDVVALKNVGLPKWTSTMIRNQDVHTNGPVLDDILLADPEISEAIGNEKMVHKTIKIYNVDRAVCGRIAGVVAKKYGETGFAGQLNITFTGSAGQSFGCFLTPGMNIRLVGEANDYVGKSISGGELVVTPAENTGFCPEDATIVGNTCLYGATGGQIFVRGKAGERFAVRNSLAQAVVEGTGDHCCEYMTGGCVVVLGKVGRNVAAGMTGGLAYFLDEDDSFIPKVNREIVKIQRVNAPVGQMQLKSLIEAHVEKTGSGKGSVILKEWDKYLPLFWQLVPPSEEDTPEACADYEKSAADEVTLQSA